MYFYLVLNNVLYMYATVYTYIQCCTCEPYLTAMSMCVIISLCVCVMRCLEKSLFTVYCKYLPSI